MSVKNANYMIVPRRPININVGDRIRVTGMWEVVQDKIEIDATWIRIKASGSWFMLERDLEIQVTVSGMSNQESDDAAIALVSNARANLQDAARLAFGQV